MRQEFREHLKCYSQCTPDALLKFNYSVFSFFPLHVLSNAEYLIVTKREIRSSVPAMPRMWKELQSIALVH